MTKSQGLSLTIIVLAAITLVVLVVLTITFSNRMGMFDRGVSSCPDGKAPRASCNSDETITRVIKATYPDEDRTETAYCCTEVD